MARFEPQSFRVMPGLWGLLLNEVAMAGARGVKEAWVRSGHMLVETRRGLLYQKGSGKARNET